MLFVSAKASLNLLPQGLVGKDQHPRAMVHDCRVWSAPTNTSAKLFAPKNQRAKYPRNSTLLASARERFLRPLR
jgi:hypothetical protein